jgi:lantibiotic leader peptide-processing serine protease
MSSPNAAAVAALVLSARSELRHEPDALTSRLEDTARTGLANYMGPNDPDNTAPALSGTACATGYCHIDQSSPISFADAYGAGLVDAGAAVGSLTQVLPSAASRPARHHLTPNVERHIRLPA